MDAILIDMEVLSEDEALVLIDRFSERIDGIILVRLVWKDFSKSFSKKIVRNAEEGYGTLFLAFKYPGQNYLEACAEDFTTVDHFIKGFSVNLLN